MEPTICRGVEPCPPREIRYLKEAHVYGKGSMEWAKGKGDRGKEVWELASGKNSLNGGRRREWLRSIGKRCELEGVNLIGRRCQKKRRRRPWEYTVNLDGTH